MVYANLLHLCSLRIKAIRVNQIPIILFLSIIKFAYKCIFINVNVADIEKEYDRRVLVHVNALSFPLIME